MSIEETAPARSARARLSPDLAGQVVRFALVGASNTLISWCLFLLFDHGLGIWYPAASALAFVAGAINGYTLNRIWTFRAGAGSASRFARYLVVQLLALAINEVTIVVCVDVIGISHLVAQLVALFCVSASTFMLSRQWAFAPPPPQAVAAPMVVAPERDRERSASR